MLLPKLKTQIAIMPALVLGLALTACGFTPVYAPGGTGSALYGQITVEAPESVSKADQANAYLLVQRLEERMGRGGSAYDLDLDLSTTSEGQAITIDSEITRYSVVGSVDFSLVRQSDGKVLASGTETAFTGYSATGSTVETLAGEQDAESRLMVILADQITARLLTLSDLSIPAAAAE